MADKSKRPSKSLAAHRPVESFIYVIRGQKVMLDSDLATLYELPTKALNQTVRRNLERFPEDFAFQLNTEEFKKWRSQIVTSNPTAKTGLRRRPFAFTQEGVACNPFEHNKDIATTILISGIQRDPAVACLRD